jgi:hypothetical protein
VSAVRRIEPGSAACFIRAARRVVRRTARIS